VKFDDFPNELEEKGQKLEKYEKLKKLVKVKDDIIWNFIIERKDEIRTLERKAKTEVEKWAK
jgi:hypothetical protein